VIVDKLLLTSVRRGNEHALQQVIDKYAAYVCTIIHNIVGKYMTHEDIEETASDVFYALWDNAENVQNLKSWIGATARNKAKNKLRKVRDELSLNDDIFADSKIQPEDMLISDYEKETMKEAILLLGSPDREIFTQHYYQSRTVATIAQKTGMSESAIKQRLVRGRKKLKTFLINKEVFVNE